MGLLTLAVLAAVIVFMLMGTLIGGESSRGDDSLGGEDSLGGFSRGPNRRPDSRDEST